MPIEAAHNHILSPEMHLNVVKGRFCDGCGVKLQFFEPKGIGFIDYKVYKTFIENEINFEANKAKEVESLVSSKAFLNMHAKLPSKKELMVWSFE